MHINVQLPDDIANHPNAGREALELLVASGYRSGALSHFQGSHLLGMTRFEFDAFLHQHDLIEEPLDEDEFEEEFENMRRNRIEGMFR